MNVPQRMNGTGHAGVPPVNDDIRVSKELGMGQPPPSDVMAADGCLADQICNEENRFDVVESAEWTIDWPMLDADINNAFGPIIDVFSTPNGNPPKGITGAYNTLSVPGMPNSNMVLWGLIVRFSVEAEGRLIRGNYVIPAAGQTQPVASPDAFTVHDVTAGVFGTTGGQPNPTPLQAELLTGFPQWRWAYDLALGYGLNWLMEHQKSLIRQPLKGVAMITPFASAEAAGIAFASNQDRIKAYNDRVAQLGFTPAGIFEPITHKRIGVFAGYGGGAEGGDFPPTREEDASPTMWGALGMPMDPFAPQPLIFRTPVFWPRGAPMSIQLEVLGNAGTPYQADAQRWLSITGGTNGQAGQDLALPISSSLSGVTLAGPQEQSNDLVPTNVDSAVQTNRMIGKIGRGSIFIGVLGKRLRQDWMGTVARAVKCGAIQAPMGYGELAAYGAV